MYTKRGGSGWKGAYIDPWVIHELRDGHPLCWLGLEQGSDELFSCKDIIKTLLMVYIKAAEMVFKHEIHKKRVSTLCSL